MREGWINKKLGDVGKITSGKAIPSSKIFEDEGEGLYPCYGGNGLRGYVDDYLYETVCPIIGRVGALCGNVHLASGRFYPTEHALVMSLKGDYNPRFIEYLLISMNLNQYAKGVAQPVLSAGTLSDLVVAIPPLSEQEHIVSELDLLKSIIDKQKALRSECDTLSWSVFYEMFGDPVENDRGWTVKTMGDLTQLYNGRAFKPTDWTNDGLPIVRIQNLNSPNSPFNYYNGKVEDAYLLHGGELLYAWSGTPGTSFGAHIWYGQEAVLNQHIFKVLFDKQSLNQTYFLYYLNGSVHSMFDKTHGGVGLQHITKGTLTAQFVPLPPLDLQHTFAQKIQSIENQKETINKAIKETQTLFDYTMDKYFG